MTKFKKLTKLQSKKALYIIFTILFLLSFNIASAARLVPGSLPSTTPLLPLPVDVLPNYQGSIDYSSEPAGDTPAIDDSEANSKNEPEDKAMPGAQKPSGRNSNLAWLALAIVFPLILAYGYFRARRFKP